METTYRVLDCKHDKEDNDDDDEEFGGLTIGGMVGVFIVAFCLGIFFHLNKKPTEGMESLVASEH